MLGADIVCSKEAEKRRALSSRFHSWAALCLGALHQAHYTDYAHLHGLSRFDRRTYLTLLVWFGILAVLSSQHYGDAGQVWRQIHENRGRATQSGFADHSGAGRHQRRRARSGARHEY